MTSSTGKLRFGRDRRLRTRRDFDGAFAARCVVSDAILILHGCRRSDGPMRVGVVVGRRYGTAVQRNRFKRIVREAFRQGQRTWPGGFDVAVRPRGKAAPLRCGEVARSLAKLIPDLVARLSRARP